MEQKLAQEESQWKETEKRAIAAEVEATKLKAQLQEQETLIRSAQIADLAYKLKASVCG